MKRVRVFQCTYDNKAYECKDLPNFMHFVTTMVCLGKSFEVKLIDDDEDLVNADLEQEVQDA